MSNTASVDIAILGGGFSGCLMALVLKQSGFQTIVIERGRHPRFAIGESSTPLASLALESICRDYDLPELLPFCKYGIWQAEFPQIPCGLKRGFSYFNHSSNKTFKFEDAHANELLVAASPDDDSADLHWYREAFDEHLADLVCGHGIPLLEETTVNTIQQDHKWQISAQQAEQAIQIEADFIIDATGAAGVLPRQLGIAQHSRQLLTRSCAVFSHFRHVEDWSTQVPESVSKDYPFNADDAALHHLLNDGWMWQLRFNNGITSAGFLLDLYRRQVPSSVTAEDLWQSKIAEYPSIAWQFRESELLRPLVLTGPLQRRLASSCGSNWALLPHTAYFIDPLFSFGNGHILFGIERLGRILRRHFDSAALSAELAEYDFQLQEEIEFLDRIVHGAYLALNDFQLFCDFSMYYFTGAIFSETRRRNGEANEDDGFLYCGHGPFRQSVFKAWQELQQLFAAGTIRDSDRTSFRERVQADITSYNLAGLCDPRKQNMYPFV